MPTPPTTVRFSDSTGEWLTELSAVSMLGQGLGGSAATAVGTLADLCAMELRRIPLSLGEAGLLADVLGAMLQVGIGRLAASELADATQGVDPLGQDLAASYEAHHDLPDGQVARLTERLMALGPAADFALRLAVARWWHRQLDATAEGFRAAGLRIVDVQAP